MPCSWRQPKSGQAGQGSEQPGGDVGIPVHCREDGLDGL